jgi:hypothetical protein
MNMDGQRLAVGVAQLVEDAGVAVNEFVHR